MFNIKSHYFDLPLSLPRLGVEPCDDEPLLVPLGLLLERLSASTKSTSEPASAVEPPDGVCPMMVPGVAELVLFVTLPTERPSELRLVFAELTVLPVKSGTVTIFTALPLLIVMSTDLPWSILLPGDGSCPMTVP